MKKRRPARHLEANESGRAVLRRRIWISKEAAFRGAALGIGCLAGFLLVEAILAVYFDSRWFASKELIYQEPVYMQFYPTDPFHHFPLDLRRAPDAEVVRRCVMDDDRFGQLRRRTPYCVLGDVTEGTPRTVTGPETATERIALIGDSFAYGEGVADNQTLGYCLSQRLGARVRNYGVWGANVDTVSQLLDFALNDQPRYHFTRVIYLFVLNDPLLTPELSQRERSLNDLINIRLQWMDQGRDLNWVMRMLWKASRWSRVAKAMVRTYAVRHVTARTIEYYHDIFDPTKNPPLLETFNKIGAMKRRAEENGLEFSLVIYPMLVELDHYPFQKEHALIAQMAAGEGVRTIDLLPTFQAHAHDDLIVHPIDMHPSARAHDLAAEAIAGAGKAVTH